MPKAPHPSPSLPSLAFAGKHMRPDNVRSHAHACPELILIVEGHCQVDTEHSTLHASAGDLLMMPAYIAHNQISNDYIHTIYVGYDADSTLVDEPGIIHLEDTQMVELCMNLLADAHMHRCTVATESCNAMLLALLSELRSVRETHRSHKAEGPSRLRLAMRYIDDHITDTITVDDLADHLNVSTSNLYLMFRNYMDTTPMHYVMKERMKRARRFLADPYMSVKEVAGACGYRDTNLFVRTFKKIHGLPPGQWRTQREGDTPD